MPNQVIPQIDFNDLVTQWLPESHRTPRFLAWHNGMINGSIKWINNNFWNYCYGDEFSNFWKGIISYQTNDRAVTYQGVYISTVSGNIGNNPDNTKSYSNLSAYNIGNSVIFLSDYYICKTNITSPEDFNPDHWTLIYGSVWYKISPSYISAQERAQYNSQKLLMEFALNRWFRTIIRQPTALTDGTASTPHGIWYTPVSDIFITTEQIEKYTFFSGETELTSCSSSDLGSGSSYSTETVILGTDSTFKFIVWIPISLSILLGLDYIKIVSNVVNLMKIEGISFSVQTY